VEILGDELARPSNDPDFAQHVIDYLRLIQNRRGEKDEMADWIMNVRSQKAGREEALQRWKAEPRSLPWLVAALMSTSGALPESEALQAAALRVPATSSAYATVQYCSARMRYEARQFPLARGQIDTFLASRSKDLPQSAVNAFTILRAKSAAGLKDLMNFAVLRPVSTGYDFGEENHEGWESCTPERKCPQALIPEPLADILNRMPVAMLLQIAETPNAPLLLRRGAAIVAWERSILLEDFPHADESARMAGSLANSDQQDLADYLKATTDEEKRFVAAFTMLHWPGAMPEFSSDVLRDEPMRQLDNFRRNWWCKELTSTIMNRDIWGHHYSPELFPSFLTTADRDAVNGELDRLQELETGPNELGKRIIPWAQTHRTDPRVPEALHLVVRATRYGCTDPTTTTYSKTAFDLLHHHYPNSVWTKKTPYYFGG
jgi:hypothetical protein